MTAEPALDPNARAGRGSTSQVARDWLRITWRFALLIAVFSTFVYLDQVVFENAVMKVVTESSASAIGIAMRAIGLDAVSSGRGVSYLGHAFVVTPECTGYEVLQLFSAAVIAAPLPWALRLRGLAMGLPILLLINFLRMVSLVFIGPHFPGFHDVGHLYTWPAIVITVALALWLTWINGAYKQLAAAGEPTKGFR